MSELTDEAAEQAFEAWRNDPDRRRRWHTCHTTTNEMLRAAFEFGRSLRQPEREGWVSVFEKRIAFWEEEMRNRPSDEQASNCYREAVHLLAAAQSEEK